MKNRRNPPPPLRSETQPLGLPHIEITRPRDWARVQAANELYRVTAEMATMCIDKGIAVSIENPRFSLMWWVPAVRALAERQDTGFSWFQHCAYGGARPKWTGWLAHPPDLFAKLDKTCPGESKDHVHASWGHDEQNGFATALETVYPEQLCEEIVRIAAERLHFAKARPLPVIRARGTVQQRRHRPEREAAGRQSRGGRGRALLPEFAQVLSVRMDVKPDDPRARPWHLGRAVG